MVKHLSLDQRLDSAAAEGLRAQLVASTNEHLRLDASAVQVLGGLCLELLMCARQLWADAGRMFVVADASPAFVENLAWFGLAPQDLSTGGLE